MIYAEWMENGQFHQGEFDTWDRFHECFFNPEKELTMVHDNTKEELTNCELGIYQCYDCPIHGQCSRENETEEETE